MDNNLDMQIVNYLLKGLSEELLELNDPELDGMTLEDIEKSEKYADLFKGRKPLSNREKQNLKMRGGGAKGKDGLAWRQQQVTRKDGTSFMQGFWVRVGDSQEKNVHHKFKDQNTGKTKKMTGNEKPHEGDVASASAFKEDGTYKPERVKFHKEIIDNFLNDPKLKSPPKGQKPIFVVMGGGSASGKSSGQDFVAEKLGLDLKNDFGTIDCDKVMAQLPEFKSLQQSSSNSRKPANMAHREASDIVTEMINQTIKTGKNFIWDGTLSKVKKTKTFIDEAKKAGYHVIIVNMTCDEDQSVVRNVKREITEKREVPMYNVVDTHKKNAETFDKVKDLADDFYLFDTNPHADGSIKMKPDLVESKEDGVLIPEMKERFNRKATMDIKQRVKELEEYKATKTTKTEKRKVKAEEKQKKHDKALEKRRKEMREKAEKNIGKSEPMMSLEEFWKSMDNPLDIDEILKSMAGESDEIVVKSEVGFLESLGIDKDGLDYRPYPNREEMDDLYEGKDIEEDEEEKDDK